MQLLRFQLAFLIRYKQDTYDSQYTISSGGVSGVVVVVVVVCGRWWVGLVLMNVVVVELAEHKRLGKGGFREGRLAW